MSDRTESLLGELVDLTRRQLANQEQALAVQQRSIEKQEQAVVMQAEALERQRTALRRVWGLIALILALIVIPWGLNVALRLTAG